ncbi:Bardet-Biedl syndrome 1 protein homolog isoform X1 [Nasonia vitripennis]|uniref:Bardet-Biedl syndrome 1 n=1 Tax=Nasonia vitripennis TaxID=7425 RepID=A0A7M7H6H8_NASVI|nr:Bardet-Biedl syndrome 1 protein homolog isoform X1 [Nasonia vitripennis]XP_031777393.1 Bardet-Biedl syndrome 1 protein homolog isoform X1 [Nasonia vitripennis]
MERTGLSTSRWLDAIWEPNTRMYTLPNGIDMLDVTGDGDARLIIADLGSSTLDDTKLRVFKGADQATEHAMTDVPCSVVGFYTENGEKKSAALAIGAGSSVFIYKNMRPHFKFCLPQLSAHPREQDIWYKAGLDEELNILSLADDLEVLQKEIGAAYLTSRTLKFLSLESEARRSFAEQYRRLPLVKTNAISIVGAIRKDSWNDIACSYLIVGTEFGEILIVDHRAFFVVEKYTIGWPVVALTTSGLWMGDGQIVVTGRDGRIGAIKKGGKFKPWETLSAPAVAIATLTCEGAAIAAMNGTFSAFSKKGVKLWKVQLLGNPLDMVSLPVPQSGLSLLAISIANLGVRIYDQKHLVDTIKTLESVSSLKYGRLGQEERAMAMVTCSGGLSVKILKRTADFSTRSNLQSNFDSPSANAKFLIPKKTKLFIEQTIRERSEAVKIHTSFQQGFLRLRLDAAIRACEITKSRHESGPVPITLQSSVLGLGPSYIVKIVVTNISEGYSSADLFLVCRDENASIKPRVVKLPLLATGIPLPVTFSVTPQGRVSNKIQVLLCSKGQIRPLSVTNVLLPVAEEDIEV